MNEIYQELHRWMALPHVWGETDCILVLADWVQRVTGIDPAERVRGTYDDPVSCQLVTGFLRDPIRVCDDFLIDGAGLKRGNQLRVGDVAVIKRLDDQKWPVGGLWLGSAWGCKGPTGATTLSPDVVQVQAFWNVGYENAT